MDTERKKIRVQDALYCLKETGMRGDIQKELSKELTLLDEELKMELGDKEFSIDYYQKYFVLDEKTGNLFVRDDFIRCLKELSSDKVWLLLKIMFYNPSLGDSEEEHFQDIYNFENGKGIYHRIRREYTSKRDSLLSELIQRDGKKCRICGSQYDITIDHIVPVARGGRNTLENLQLLCRVCNSRKGTK